jgi:hypothetical protein
MFSADFFMAMEVARRPVLEASVQAFASMPSRVFVPRWFLMLYQIIQATESVLDFALDDIQCRAPDSDRQDRCHLQAFYERKLRDEHGHDRLLLDDLARVGVSASRVFSAPVNPLIAEMVGRQFYLIEFVHPATYLGFIGLLEGFPPTMEQIDAIQAASGLPTEAFSCARLHAKADVGHREELAKMLDEVPAHLHAAILANGLRCAALQCAALEHLSQQENPQ